MPSFPSTYLCFFMAKAEKKLEKYIFSLADDEVIVGAALGEFFVKCLSVFMSVCVSFVICVRGCTSSFQKCAYMLANSRPVLVYVIKSNLTCSTIRAHSWSREERIWQIVGACLMPSRYLQRLARRNLGRLRLSGRR